ncbi:MAG: adenosine deaminase [Acidiferrobacteraceae bacterium]|nr:adenosine deaminase [Acidiferrobacteraceae bacterium]|tara:strand:- start:4853 stop:5860 length:1008 start_codon:yes stop_codon:yes gene_type:complete
MEDINKFLRELPKTELHLHIEGTLEPEMMMSLADRNHVRLPWTTLEDTNSAYKFENLQSFLDIYYQGITVLHTEEDFFDLTFAYLQRAASDSVRHTEIFFDPQSHTERGIPYEVVVDGIHAALMDGEKYLGISSELILCFLRHLPPTSALNTLETALAYKNGIIGVGLDSSELSFPPINFLEVFEKARSIGLRTVAHAGEEGPPEYIWEALDILKVDRIDHGVRCLEDPLLVEKLRLSQTPLTVCPLSNIKLKVFSSMSQHNILKLSEAGLCITINSDDPAYFDGYINDNYAAVYQAFNLSISDLLLYAKQSIQASFASESRKTALLAEINQLIV